MKTNKVLEGKHTPGPWTVIDGANGHSLIISNKGEHIVDACYLNDNYANAPLIASAPEMLGQLKRLRDLILSGEVVSMSEGRRLNAVIEKAEGGV